MIVPTALSSDDALIDRIYEAAVIPGLWKPVLDQLAHRVSAEGAGLFLLSDRNDPVAIWSDALEDLWAGWVEGGWQAKTQRAPRMMALNHAGFVTESDIYAPGEMEQDEAFASYLKPRGFGYGAGSGVIIPTGETAIFSLEKRYDEGPMTREDCQSLDILRPHLARAALLTGRSSLDRAHTMAGTLQSLGIPGAVIRENGRLLAANDLFEALMPGIVQDRHNRIQLTAPDADRLLGRALADLRSSAGRGSVSSIPVAATKHSVPLIFHLVPARRDAQDVILSGSAFLIVTPVDHSAVPSANVLQGLFDLTPAEARIARAIGNASTIDQIADAGGVTRETVRNQLKTVMAKTGTRRQAELVSLLAGKTIGDGERD